MNSNQEIAFRNQLLRDRLDAEEIKYSWQNISHLVESATPVFVAVVSCVHMQIAMEFWISYDEYLPSYTIDTVEGESFIDGVGPISLDMVIICLHTVL
jgi:hypothetical protein